MRTAAAENSERGAKAAAMLDERTAMLAGGARLLKKSVDRIDYLKLEAAAERYALPLAAVAGVLAARPLGPIVTRRSEIIGTLYERAEVWPVYSLPALLGAGASEAKEAAAILLLRHDSRRVALAVERIDGLESADLAQFSKTGMAAPHSLVSGASTEGLMLIEEGALWRHPALTHGRLS